MFNLTKQEKYVLLFLASVVLVGIVINHLQKINPRFKNFADHPAPSLNLRINLNKASLAELTGLPGIGPELARRILDYRASHNGFKAIDEIRKVKGIGSHKFEGLKGQISIE